MSELGDPRRNEAMARRANAAGAAFSLRIIWEARRVPMPPSLGFALVQQESGFRNVFGHDPTIFVGAGLVTQEKYAAYLLERGRHGEGGMQGVGPCQLTWWSYQDQADALGGCWDSRHNIHVGFQLLGRLMGVHGYEVGIARYNGSGPAATAYSRTVRSGARRWHEILQ